MGESRARQSVAAPKRTSHLRLKGLGAHLILAQLLVVALLVGIGWLSQRNASDAEKRVLGVYDRRILPLHRLGRLADVFAIDFVDTVHKVADGSVTPADGVERLERVRRDAARDWAEVERTAVAPQERKLLEQARPVLMDALQSLAAAEAKMNAENTGGLATWRRTELYRRVDPLTTRLSQQIADAMRDAHADVMGLQADMKRAAFQSSLSLGFAGLLAIIASVTVAARFVASLRRVEAVVQRAAEGDLSARIALPGDDELSAMAARIDDMIAAIQASQQKLSDQARALARSEAEARAASSAKSAFLGTVSHELRTPLNVILGYTQVLERNPTLPPDARHGLLRIGEAGEHLLQLIDDVIGVARSQAGTLHLKLAPFSPNELLSELPRMLGDRARQRGLTLTIERSGQVPKTVSGDRRRLLQILLNLTGNALKFTRQGGVTVQASWQDERLRFVVRDTGPGIAPGEQALLFQAFSQGELGRNAGEGTGLGLHISRELARAMGGDITLESQLGQGATFTCEVDAPEALSAPAQARERRLRSAPPDHGLPPMLVVDDRPTNREALTALLRAVGFEAHEADSGEAALEYLETNRPALVWLDLKMSGIDGIEVVRRVRESERTSAAPRLPVVAITASVVDLDAGQVRALGFDAWVPKPFRTEAVLEAIELLLHVQLVDEGAAPTQTDTRSETFDIERLTAGERAHLRSLLLLGDINAAAEWATKLGPDADALVREINSFRTEGLLARLD